MEQIIRGAALYKSIFLCLMSCWTNTSEYRMIQDNLLSVRVVFIQSPTRQQELSTDLSFSSRNLNLLPLCRRKTFFHISVKMECAIAVYCWSVVLEES